MQGDECQPLRVVGLSPSPCRPQDAVVLDHVKQQSCLRLGRFCYHKTNEESKEVGVERIQKIKVTID